MFLEYLSQVYTSAFTIFFAIFTAALVSSLVYNLYFHPLARIPGPKVWVAIRFRYIASLVSGNIVQAVREIHETYGDIVRLAPNEVSFAREDAYDDIHLHRHGQISFNENPIFYAAPPGQPDNLITTSDHVAHARMRKIMSHSFTEKSVKAQEPIIESYVDLFISRLNEKVTTHKKNGSDAVINIVDWYNYVAFDIVGDLGFGEPFDCLKHDTLHPWIAMMFDSLQSMILAISLRYYPWLNHIAMTYLVPKSILQKAADHYQLALDKIHRRLNLEKQRDDFMTPVLQAQHNTSDSNDNNEKGMTMPEIESTFSLLIIAGSETVATCLSATTHHLLSNPPVLQVLTHEILTAFPLSSSTPITISSLKHLPYLTACINESLRLSNPVPAGLPYIVPQGGSTVSGIFLPEGTNVSVHPATLNIHPRLFHRARDYCPERWLANPPEAFRNDKLGAVHPFGIGHRVCLGKGVAMAEVRLVLARLVREFVVGRVEGKEVVDWLGLKTYVVVKKEPVWVRLRARK